MSQLLAQKRKSGEKQWPLPTPANKSHFAELFLNFDIICYIVFLNDNSVLLAFMFPNLILSVQLKHLCPLFPVNNEEFI